MAELTADRARRAIVEYTGHLAETAAAAGPDAAVPTAPKWTVTDLVEHIGQTQHWVAEIIERRITDPTQLPRNCPRSRTTPCAWPARPAESARRVADACSDDALDAPVRNSAADGCSGTRFWLSSMVNEAVVHGADAIRGTGQILQWLATDTPDDAGARFVERRPDGRPGIPEAGRPTSRWPDPQHPLLLVLTRRLPFIDYEAAGIRIDGDVTLVRHRIDNTAHNSG